jgi:hypothetical protein
VDSWRDGRRGRCVGCSWCLCPVPLCFATRLRFATWRAPISSAASWISGVASPPRVANSVSTTPVFGDAGVWPPICGTLISAAVLRHRPPRGRLRWSLSQLISGGYTRAPLSFRWAPWDPGGYTRAGSSRGGCPPYLQESKIKSHSIFQINKISRDVKGLFLGVRFVSSRVELGCSSRTSCMSRWGVVLEESRAY